MFFFLKCVPFWPINYINADSLYDFNMAELGKKVRVSTLLISLDVIGFLLVFVGAGLIRFAKDELISILGGFVLAGGVAVISLTRFINK
jgi:hypothetical protein